MDATQMISDSILESDDEENEEENREKRGRPLAKLCILKNEHIPEGELPLFLGDNVLGRDPNTCTLPLLAPSISKQHATICISVYRKKGCHSEVDTEALVWDLGSMNGTRKGRLKLTPNVRYALSESDSLVMADIPCKYVSCAVDGASSQGGVRTPVSRNSGVNVRLPDASAEKGGYTSTGSKKCVNGRCLSFEQTLTQPQRTLVPESDSDSEGEREGGGDRRHKALVSDSDSYKSSPTCSTFLSPTNKIVPESEDESPITPSSTKNRPNVDVGRRQLNEKKALAIVDDSEKEEGREEERAALGGRKSEESGHHVPVEQESNVSLTGVDELPVSTPAVVTHVIPAFNMDSDTDMEGEEEGVASVGPVTSNTNQQADQPPNTAHFHMDSDTDVDDDALDKVPKSVPFSADTTRPPNVGSVIQPEGITMDSDTDVDEDAVVSDAATKAKPMSFQSTHTADSAPSSQLKDFHLDSDTDLDEEEEKECGTNTTCPKINETPTRLDIKPFVPEHATATPHNLHLNSDTDDEAIPAPVISKPSVVSDLTESCTTADTGADLGILSDSDTDVEDNSPLVVPVVVTTLSVAPHAKSEAFQSDSNADTDVDESSEPPAGDVANLADLRVDSDTDVKMKKLDFGEAGEGQIPSLRRENTPGLLAPVLQNCSTPSPLSEGEIEGMETQAFLAPSTGPYSRRLVAPAVRPIGLSSCSDSQEDEDFVVAETQSFVLQTRDCEGNPPGDHTMDPTQSFVIESSGDEKGEQSSRGGSLQLGLSDSSHMQRQAQALAMESTEAFPFVEGAVNLEDTQAYAAISNADRTSCENDSNLEATQAYGEHVEPVNCSVMSEKEVQVDLALEATQAYILEPYSNSEDETDEDERINTATAEPQPLDFPTSSTLAMAETQPMSAFEEEEILDQEKPVSSVLQVMPKQNDTEERDEHGEAALPQERHLNEAPSVAETQPMRTSDDEVDTGEVGESDNEDSIPGPRKGKAKPPQLEEEQTQPLTSFELSAVETQPMLTGEDGESDDEDSILGPHKRKAKPLQLEEEQTQPLTSSETQPMATSGNEESDEEDLIPGPRKRKAKALQLEEEETQPLIISEISAVEMQPTGEGGGNDNEDAVPHTSKRKALQMQEEDTQPLTNSEASTVETQPLETKAGLCPQRGKGRQLEAGASGITIRGKRGTPAKLREEKVEAECSEPSKRQTRGKSNALATSRGSRGKSRPEESEEEVEVEQGKRARGKKSMRRQKDGEEERLGTERNEHADNNTLIKEQEEEQLGEEKDRERKELEHQARLEKEAKEREEREKLEKEKEAKEKQIKEQQYNKEEEENKPKTPARSRRTRRTIAAPCTSELDSAISTNDDVPARRTRSRSNSSNSVSSERSVSSVNTKQSRGRGRGRGAKRSSELPQAAIGRGSNRRSTVAARPLELDSKDVSPQEVLSRSNSTNSLSSEISSCSLSSQSRGRGGRQRGRGRKTEAATIPPINSQCDQNSAPKPATTGRKSRKAEESSNEVLNENEKADSQQANTTRGQQRANANGSQPAAAGEEDPSNQEEECASDESILPITNVRGRDQKAVKSNTVEAPLPPAVSDGEGDKEKTKGRKRELDANTEEDSSSNSKISKGKEKLQITEAAKDGAIDETPLQAKRRGRASTAHAKKNVKDSPTALEGKEESEKIEEAVERRGRGRPSAVQKKKKEVQKESGTSLEQDTEASEHKTPTSSVSRKRQASADSSPVAKTPRSSSASPAASGRLRIASQTYKVLFTGVVDEVGERVLARLGGSMAKGVADMNCLVTDKVRRTVKFLCAVAKGVPIVTTHWLEKSGKAGSFLSPNAFIVKDPEQEKKFNFCLQESLRIASSQLLLQGYQIHVTKSVKPEPIQMKDIITCSGATFLPKVPSSHKPHTVVISCEEDLPLCGPALSASLPVVTAEFILTGTLQQKLDFQAHALSATTSSLPTAGGRGRGRKKT
ncbi:mediator of DNA damage checkpoint protein 1 [Micropterus dolomieu]|uniref:mediator of DNA damage checkpoint protein 1 n=1 Tax=Micropterus dolomieu TaxID=147949 RepID=UPI001E8DFBD4|nr:mediator of DNA damage checkpoint protein 1 [Micropterus dolomieu]